jgi:hypothetical protein
MLNSDSQEMLQCLADKYKEEGGKDVVWNFDNNDMENFEKHQEYKFHLEELETLDYVNVNKEPYMTGEFWMVKVTPKAYMYLKDKQK